MDWKNRKVLVTGGASFIGSSLADALVKRGAKVRVVDDVLVDSMRGRSSTWTRIRVNLRHVPEPLRPAESYRFTHAGVNSRILWLVSEP